LSNSTVSSNPGTYFTKDFSHYKQVTTLTVYKQSQMFWEMDCLFCLVRSGAGEIVVNQVSYQLSENAVCFLELSKVFYFRADSPAAPLVIDVIILPCPELGLFDVFPSNPSRTPHEISPAYIPPCMQLNGSYARQVSQSFDEYRTESQSGKDYCIQACLAQRIFYLLLDFSYSLQSKIERPTISGSAIDYIYAHCSDPISALSVANELGISIRKLNVGLYYLCGRNFQQVLTRARVCTACAHFFRNMSLDIIALNSGFSNYMTFFRSFSEIKGTTPNQYREAYLALIQKSAPSQALDSFVEICRYLAENFKSPITCKTCADSLFITTDAIESILKHRYGANCSFSALLRQMRLLYAETLLAMTDLHVVDVAFDSGFNSVHTFIRQFKSRNGCTPNEYRKQIRSQHSHEV